MAFRRALPYVGYLAVGAGSLQMLQQTTAFTSAGEEGRRFSLASRVPTRAQQLSRLREYTADAPCDVLVIGGGATGAGCALDATARGLKTVLIEREDFGSGTSSKSTKLIHGGVRYLEKAVFNLDYGQLKLVLEALAERKAMIDNAPHLSNALPILMPCYKWWEVPFYWAGLKAYDLLAGSQALVWSKYLTPDAARRELPTLTPKQADGSLLKGAVKYYDGQFNDARLNVALACTAAAGGAVVANYTNCEQLIKNGQGQVIGARCKDTETGALVDVYARTIINAAGPFTDSVRRLSDASAQQIIRPSAGAHITLPDYYCSSSAGMIVPKTKDGRIVFMLPWLGGVIAGTTDVDAQATSRPKASEEEVEFILDAISDYLKIKVQRSDVLSVWSGIRPLAADPNAASTANTSRDHVLIHDPSGLITITGGKWTTYRRMAQDAVDMAVATGRLPPATFCRTMYLKLLGGEYYHDTMHADIAQKARSAFGMALDSSTCQHLARTYGDQAYVVLQLAKERGLLTPLVPGHPELEAEVLYAMRHEYCSRPEDFLSRRSRLAYLDAAAARAAVPRVAELMGRQLGWSQARRQRAVQEAMQYLETFST